MIGVETQTVMLNIPADPGMPDSMERTIPQVTQPALLTTQPGPVGLHVSVLVIS